MMYLSDSNKVVKVQDIKLTGSPVCHAGTGRREKALGRFIRGICHIPSKKEDFNACENNMNIASEIKEPGKQVEERIKIAEKEAYDRGFSKGLTEGIERKKKELSFAVESVAKLTRELKILKEELLESSEKKIIDLVFLIAGKVIHKEVSTDREVVLSVLSDAMRNMQERDGISICLNPEDHRYITEAKPDFFDSFGDILIEKDEKIGQGGAVINTHSGTLDARLDQQLDKIRDQVPGVSGQG